MPYLNLVRTAGPTTLSNIGLSVMHKKIILALFTFSVVAGAYFVFSYGDRTVTPPDPGDATEAVRVFVTKPTTQATQTLNSQGVDFSPGDQTAVRVYDDITGRLKYQFEAERWEPTGRDTDFHVEELLIQIHMPRGEVTRISADKADITLARKSRNRTEAQRGILKGNVKVVIDRTTTEWRVQHPELARLENHPESLVTILMETARFDMDRAELVSDGTVEVDSAEARIENTRGLTVHWDQVDNRVEMLRFDHGGKMVLRRGVNIVDFALPGAERKKRKRSPETDRTGGVDAAALATVDLKIPRAQANQPKAIATITAQQAAEEIRVAGGSVRANQPKSIATTSDARQPGQLRTPEELAADRQKMTGELRSSETPAGGPTDVATSADLSKPKRRKIHTYKVLFNHEVLVEQFDGERRVGQLTADTLEVHFDFGARQRQLTKSPSETSANRAATAEPAEPVPSDVEEDGSGRIVLTWNGPMELRPISSNPAEQTGKRFNIIATGTPVTTVSEQGHATCRQLVYRNERRQVWLSGTDAEPVELSVSESRKLVGREIFFDQQRGLGRVDGPGYMLDDRSESPIGVASNGESSAASKPAKPRESVEIRWSRGVDIEMGERLVHRMDPATGALRDKEKEFLRRAWFHGDVVFKQGDEILTADEVAATFGLPMSDDAVADFIEHLNMTGSVRLVRQDDLIAAERLDVELVLTPDGKNIPRKVDAVGKVTARQLNREINADVMHVLLGRYPGPMKLAADGRTRIMGKARLGIEHLEASGSVLVKDPGHNLKISRAEQLTVQLRNGQELVRTLIVSKTPDVFARSRYEDMAIHGHRIEIDMDTQAVDVPGPGKAWMVTRQDFGGRKLSGPSTVKTTWTGRMQLRMARNYGVFMGDVMSRSKEFAVTCDKLTIRFARTPPVRQKQSTDFLDRFAVLGALQDDDEITLKPGVVVSGSLERKRPAYVVAEGGAEALSSTHAPAADGETEGRLLSRLRVAGNQIIADLAREQMSVPCEGTLLIEDYQFRAKGGAGLRVSSVESPLMSSMRSDGPSQSLVTWKNSMDFFVDRGLVAFDKDVRMVHRSGRQMVLKDELAEVLKIDASDLGQLSSGRKATLTCGNLLLEFRAGVASDKGPMSRATDLERLIARHAVHLQEGSKSLMGNYLQYLHGTSEVRLEGNDSLEARIVDQDEDTQRLSMWRGPLLIWNRTTNEIEAPKARIRTSSR